MSSVSSAAGLLRGRISIVTGSSSGLGRATALAFARQGASVVCADRVSSPPSQLQVPTHELIRENGGESAFFSTDVADAQSVQNLVRSAAKEFGRLDIMVNNAGIAPEASEPKPVWETDEKDFDAVQEVNVRGVFLGCKYAGAQMLAQSRPPREHQDRAGTIINVGSVLGVLGFRGTPAYAASKGAVAAMTRAAAMDFAPYGIHCNAILPGFTRTPMISSMTDGSQVEQHFSQCHPFQRLGTPEEIADAAVFLASDMSKGITGVNLSVDGGLHGQLRM